MILLNLAMQGCHTHKHMIGLRLRHANPFSWSGTFNGEKSYSERGREVNSLVVEFCALILIGLPLPTLYQVLKHFEFDEDDLQKSKLVDLKKKKNCLITTNVSFSQLKYDCLVPSSSDGQQQQQYASSSQCLSKVLPAIIPSGCFH